MQGLGGDGGHLFNSSAAVMVGARRGIITHLKEKIPYVVGVHCMAHGPTFRNAVKNIRFYQAIDDQLLGLYS